MQVLPQPNDRSGIDVLDGGLLLLVPELLQCRHESAERIGIVTPYAPEQRCYPVAGRGHALGERRIRPAGCGAAMLLRRGSAAARERRGALTQRPGVVREASGEISSEVTAHGGKIGGVPPDVYAGARPGSRAPDVS